MLTKSRKYFNQTWIESLFKQTTALFALLVFILLAAILISLVMGSWESIKRFGGEFSIRNILGSCTRTIWGNYSYFRYAYYSGYRIIYQTHFILVLLFF